MARRRRAREAEAANSEKTSVTQLPGLAIYEMSPVSLESIAKRSSWLNEDAKTRMEPQREIDLENGRQARAVPVVARQEV